MSVAIHVAGRAWPLGSGDFVHAFFSTVTYHLEPGGWGSRFPALMNGLYEVSSRPDARRRRCASWTRSVQG